MSVDDIHLWDWSRLLCGGLPAVFLIEVIIRGFFLYGLLFISMRLMGRRLAGQLNRLEISAIVSLAATVGIPMQSPEKGLIPALIAAITIVTLHSFITNFAFKNSRVESLILEKVEAVVKDGCLQISALKKNALSTELIFSHLRGAGVKNLGLVKRLYYEPNGGFSLLKYDETKTGLSLIPGWDVQMRDRETKNEQMTSCAECGLTEVLSAESSQICKNCCAVSARTQSFDTA